MPNSKKKKGKGPAAPTTADEYLAAGVDFEEAGEKWRGGDAAKSLRFFVRAIGLYDDALRLFPESFDLAYNKARVQYELTQCPKLAPELPAPLVELLKTALQSSEVALRWNRENADALFNTAQCYTSLVEAIASDPSYPPDPEQGFKYLERAIGQFQQCLAIQETSYEESQAQMQAHPDVEDNTEDAAQQLGEADTEMDIDTEVGANEAEDKWATIIEPVTVDALLDSLVALLETLTAFCNLLAVNQPPTPKTFSWLEEVSTTLLNTKLPAYLSISSDPVPAERCIEIFIARANFLAAMADATFQAGNMDIPTYARIIEEAFSYESLSKNLATNPEGLCNKAEALMSFNQSVRYLAESQNPTSERLQQVLAARWKALATAVAGLTAATKLPNVENLVKIHLTRGDAELMRYRLGIPYTPGAVVFESAAKNGATLLKNASTYYRGAAAHAKLDAASWGEELKEAIVKEAVVEEMRKGNGFNGFGKGAEGFSKEEGKKVLVDMIEDGLIVLGGP